MSHPAQTWSIVFSGAASISASAHRGEATEDGPVVMEDFDDGRPGCEVRVKSAEKQSLFTPSPISYHLVILNLAFCHPERK
jgi:hypothetical protein